MAIMPGSSTCLELTMSIPRSSSSSGGECGMRELDINQVPLGENIEGEMEEEDDPSSINGGHPRKKLRLTKEQSLLLEESFRQNHTLNPKQKEVLAMQLRLKPRQVEVWFQNRRARSKLKQTEMECEYLKRWFGSLTDQNRRLQREVEELRAKKVGPPTVFSSHSREPLPASTLTMCPCCERVTTTTITTTAVRPVVDQGGPTTQGGNPNLSAKTLQFLHPRHPSAAC